MKKDATLTKRNAINPIKLISSLFEEKTFHGMVCSPLDLMGVMSWKKETRHWQNVTLSIESYSHAYTVQLNLHIYNININQYSIFTSVYYSLL